MPWVIPAVTSSIMSAGSGLGLVGPDFAKIAQAVAVTCQAVFLLPGTVVVTATGAAGAGAIAPGPPVTGITPKTMADLMYVRMSATGMLGTQAYNQAMAISTGVVSGVSTLVLTGPCPGVGAGVGMGKIVGFNNVLFSTTLYTNMASLGMFGINAIPLAAAIGDGVCLSLNAAGTVPGVPIVGPAGPAPAATVFPAQFI